MNSHLILYNKQKKLAASFIFMIFNRLVKKYTLTCCRCSFQNELKKHLQFNNIDMLTIVHDLLVTKSDLSLNSG
ncbi:hypothetical protein JAMGFMIE_04077 [Rheinheimera sp. MM224]|nr:hypothetical protein JAMGFMIE_04077 [Rheinheimera sp. MM224]